MGLVHEAPTGYLFEDQLKRGLTGEEALDRTFCLFYTVCPVDGMLQRLGIDRIFEDRDGVFFSVEYKTDDRMAETGNLFVETISVDVDGKSGWAYTCLAQFLIYYVPSYNIAHMLPMMEIKLKLPQWVKSYEARPARNLDRAGRVKYLTWGLPVPLREIKALPGYQSRFIAPE